MSITIERADHVTVQLGTSATTEALLQRLLAPQPTATLEAFADSSSALQPPAPGTLWPEQGGWYAGVCCAPDGTRWHLVQPEGDAFRLDDVAWGLQGDEVPGVSSNHDGLANTEAMLAAGNPLAEAVRAMGEGCYLPSRAEALLLFTTLKDQIGDGAAWTSTQFSAHLAWCQYFGSGLQDGYDKDCEFRAVAVRRLIF